MTFATKIGVMNTRRENLERQTTGLDEFDTLIDYHRDSVGLDDSASDSAMFNIEKRNVGSAFILNNNPLGKLGSAKLGSLGMGAWGTVYP